MPKSDHKPKEILLISNATAHADIFTELCEDKEFAIFDVIKDIESIQDALKKGGFDLIIASSTIDDLDVISFFYDNQIAVQSSIPLIFILDKNLSKDSMKLFDKLKVNFVYEDYLDIPHLDYSLKTALQKHKVLSLMKENQLRYKSLYDHTLDINLITNLDFTVIDTNVQGRKQLKFEEAFPLKSLFKYQKEYKKFIKLLLEVEQVSRFETTLKIRNKIYVCLLDAFMLYDSKQNRSGAHLLVRNIDAEKKSQDIANRASKLMVTGKFLRSLAHEIRNPLTNINLALEQLNAEGEIPPDSQLYLDVVQRSANRVKDLLEEIMNAYKTADINLKTEHLHNIIDHAIRFANDRLILHKVKLKLSLDLKNDLLKADKVKLTTAILNLIINACEAIDHQEGKITIKTSKKGKFYYLSIKDNGCGMDAMQTAALFDPFYTGKSKGLGLGLTTAQNVIFAHKGSINVQSKVNVGTKFTIKLPIHV